MVGGSPYVGRQRELGLLREALTTPGRVLLVSGAAGIGKSRSVDEAVSGAGASAVVLRGDCLPLSEPLPLSPIVDVLAGFQEDPRTAAVWSRAPMRLRESLTRLSDPATGSAGARAGRRAEVFAAVRELLTSAGAVVPLVVVVEDVQWVDVASADLLTYLVAPAHLRTYSVVVTRRDDPSVDVTPHASRLLLGLARHPGFQPVAVGPLDHRECRSLAAALAGADLSTAAVTRAADRAEGNPLFLEQLVEHARSRPDDTSPRVPLRVGELVLARLDELDPLAAQVATALAVARTDLSEDALVDVTGRPRAQVRASLEVLARRGLLRPLGPGLSHRLHHGLLEDAVVGSLPREALADWHRRVGHAMARTAGRCDLVADHLRACGDRVDEVPWRYDAALEADRLSFGTRAAEHWVRLCELVEGDEGLEPPGGLTRAGLLARAARACKQEGRPDLATDLARRGRQAFSDEDDDATTVGLLMSVGHHSTPQHQEAGRRAAGEALAILERLPPCADRVEAAYDLWFYSQDRPAAADVHRAVVGALPSAALLAEPFPRVKLTLALAHLQSAGGEDDAAAATLEEARRLLPREAPLEERMFLALHRADLFGTWGRSAGVYDRWTADLLDEARAVDPTASEVMSILRWNVARLLLTEGSLEQAAEVVDPSIMGDPVPEDDASRLVHCARAALDMVRGDLPASLRRWAALPTSDLAETVGEVEPWRVETLLWAGDVGAAVERARAAYAVVADRSGSRVRDRDELLLMAARAASTRMRSASARTGADDRRFLEDLGETLRQDVADRRPSVRSHLDLLTYDVERARAEGSDEPEAWAAVADASEGLRLAGRATYARWRETEALHRRGAGPAALTESVERALAASTGHRPAHRTIRELASRIGVPLSTPGQASPLTTRETAVLTWVARGLTNQQVARRLGISPRTVDVHLRNLMRKLGATSRLQAVLTAQRLGLVDATAVPPLGDDAAPVG